MAYTKLLRVIDAIYQRTESNQIAWRENGGDSVIANFSGASVRVSTYGGDYFLKLESDLGEVLENISDVQLYEEGHKIQAKRLKDIYEIARRKVLGVEDILDNLLNEIEPSDEIPF